MRCIRSWLLKTRWTKAGTGYAWDDIMFLSHHLLFLLLFPHQNSSCFPTLYIAVGAIIAQCRTREQSEDTSEGHLVQPLSKCRIRGGCPGPFQTKRAKLQQWRAHHLPAASCCALPRSCGSCSCFSSHGNFSHWNLWLLSFVFTLQSEADPVSSVTTL